MMTRTTNRDRIHTVAKRWHLQYPPGSDERHLAVGRKLDDLDLEKVTSAEINAIIGNSSWTEQFCDHCGYATDEDAYTIGEPPDYESATATLCGDCAKKFCELFLGQWVDQPHVRE